MSKFLQHIPLLFVAMLAQAEETVLVAVASNFVHTMPQIESTYSDSKKTNVRLSFGSSGNFSRQIIQGAPYDIFISANEKYIQHINARNISITAIAVFAEGSMSLYIPANSSLHAKDSLQNALQSIRNGKFTKIAIPNPEHAPYGIAAKQALSKTGVWAIASNQLLLAENASQAMQFCVTGNVDACIIPSSFMFIPTLNNTAKHFTIPSAWHQPIKQYVALLNDKPASRSFYQHLLSSQSKHLLHTSGYRITH